MKKILFFGGIIIYILIICGGFVYFSIDKEENNNVTLIDTPGTDTNDKNKEIINGYRDKYNNDDVVGEISIVNSDYKKPIMQSNDNDYYLNHTEDKSYNYMGSIYLDFRVDIDNDKKLLIFGHNSDTIDMPFKILENYYDENYYKEHKYIQITTENKTRLYEIYAVYVEVDDFYYMQTDFESKEQWYNHIISLKNKSMYDTGVQLNEDDNILILQTCSTHKDYKNYEKKYLLIVAKEVK